jgi:hypothetical protein
MSCGKPPASEEPAHGRARNGLATASLVAGIAGVTLVTIVPALACGVLGLRRARQTGPRGRRAGQVRCWAGIGLAVIWAAAGLYLLPHLVRAADPGCAAYKGTALAAYHRVIADFGGAGGNGGPEGAISGDGGGITGDMSRAVTRLDQAAARSHSPVTARDLARLARQLRAVLTEIRDGKVVPATALTALNADSARADAACGTLRV